MNTHNIRDLHGELVENEELVLFFNCQNHNILFITPADKLTYEKGDLIVENNDFKQIIAPDSIIRVCKRRVP